MQITLKKANELQRIVLEAATKIEPQTTVAVSPYDVKSTNKTHLEDVIQKNGAAKFSESMDSMFALMNIAYEIRDMLGEANANSGINTLLNKRALVEAKEKRLVKIITTAEEVVGENTVDEALGRVQRFNSLGTNNYYEQDVKLTVVDAADLKAMKAELSKIKQQKSDLTDQLAGLNLNTKIKLSDAMVEFLRSQDILS